MTKHIETPSAVLGQRLIDDIDEELAFPKLPRVIGAKSSINIAACEAWIANHQGDPPPGVTASWDVSGPLPHPSQGGRFAVVVTDDVLARIAGHQPPGWAQAISAQDAVERGQEWLGGTVGQGAQALGRSV